MSRALSHLTCATGLLLATASCHNATSPLQRREQRIYAIQVPQRAAIGDTIRTVSTTPVVSVIAGLSSSRN